MTELICPLAKLSLGNAVRFCDEEKCAWFDVDDGCCCIRVAVRGLEDFCDFIGRIEAKTEDRGEHP